MSDPDAIPIPERANPPKQAPAVIPRLRVEREDAVFQLRRLPLREIDPSFVWLPCLASVVYIIPVIGIFLQGNFGVALVLLGVVGVLFLLNLLGSQTEIQDEERLTITDDAVIMETVSPSPRRRKRRNLGLPQDLQYKVVHSGKSSAGRIACWIGKETVHFSCDNTQQRNEIFASLEEFMRRFAGRPQKLLVPYKTRSFFQPTGNGFVIELPSPYSRSSFSEKLLAGFLILFLGGFFWGQFLWTAPNFIRMCLHFRQIFPPEQAVEMFAITAGCWLIYFFCFVFLPLMSLNRSYWTRWEIRMNREDDEATAFCSSMFGRKRARSPISRWSVCCKPKQSFLRILWLPHWLSPEPMWEQAGLRFCFEGRKFVLPCGSREEADWLISLIQNAGVEVIDDACDELKFVAKY